MQCFAIYDMDKTITRAPTWTGFLIATARHVAPWRLALLPLAGLATCVYAARLINRAQLKQVTQLLMLGDRMDPVTADGAAARFADHIIASGVFGAARAQIASDKAAGCRLVMATASYGFYAAAIATRLGFDDVVATRVQHDAQGRLRARIAGENCYGPAKLRMIEAWMAAEGIARSAVHVRFYSDHVSDAPTFAWADEAVAVNAHGPLQRLARERGWRVGGW